MKLLIIVPNFIPEIGSAAHIYFDLAKGFIKKGHDVDVITSYPRTYYLAESIKKTSYPIEETIEGINIHRCKYPIMRDNILIRGLEHFILPHYYFKTYKKIGIKFDGCLIYIPPLPLYYVAKKIKRFDGTPSILNYQDFHPQELIDVGILKNYFMEKIMECIEIKSYKNSDFITVLTKGGINFVTDRGGNPGKISHIYNAVDLNEIYLMKKENNFKKLEKIENKFLISYAGILSYCQNIDFIIDTAKKLIDKQEIIFYIVGDGNYRDHLIERVNVEKIKNVKILPLQPRDKYFDIVNSSDISLISLDNRMNTPCLPGKTINIMAMGQPIIAIVPEKSETAKVILKSQSGIVVKPGDIDNFIDNILKFMDNPTLRKEYGKNGRLFVEKNMNLDLTISEYEQIFGFLKLFDYE